MAAIFAFRCSCCGEVHEGSPSFGYRAPRSYDDLSDADKERIATIDSDLCRIEYPDQTDYFARVTLEIPIHGIDEPFMWGVWVSLSAKSFERYTSTWGDHDESDSYFGWLCNRLPWYPDTINLKTNVRPRRDGLRPYIELQECDHPLAVHWQAGISISQAQEIAEAALHAYG